MSDLPADPGLELAFIRSILQDWSAFTHVVQYLAPDAFTDHREAAEVLYECFRRGIVPGEATVQAVASEMDCSFDYTLYYDAQVREDVNYLSGQLLDIYSRRLEVLFADEVTRAAYHPKITHSKRLDDVFNGVHKLLSTRQVQHGRITNNFGERYRALIASRQRRSPEELMRFAWSGIDVLGPALDKGDFVAVAGDPGAGKTIVLEQQGEFWAKLGYSGVLYHLELNSDRMQDRRVARATGIPLKLLQDVRDDVALSATNAAQVEMALEYIDSWPGVLELQYAPGWAMSQIVADMRQRAQVGPLDFVMVDYMNKIRLEPSKGSYVTWEIGQMLELFKSTLDQLGLVGWMAAQFPKGRDRRRTIGDARDTGELEDKCNVGIVIYREMDEQTSRRFNTGELRVTKFNAGREDSVPIKLIPTQFVFLGVDEVDF